MAITPEERSMRERNMYFNAKRVEAFEDVKGITILIDAVDATGKPIKLALTAPEDIREFTYLGYDRLVELFRKGRAEEEEE